VPSSLHAREMRLKESRLVWLRGEGDTDGALARQLRLGSARVM